MSEPMQIRSYVVLAVHPLSGASYTVELKAMRDRGAIARVKLALMHRDEDAEWLRGSFTILEGN